MLVASCSGSSDAAPIPAGVEGAWVFAEGTHRGTSIDLPDDASMTMDIAVDNGAATISGQSICNRYGSDLDVTSETVTAGLLEFTAMGCEQPLMTIESQYFAGLDDMTSVEANDDRLTLTGPTTRFVFAPAEG